MRVALRVLLLAVGLCALLWALRGASWPQISAIVGGIGAPVLLILLPQGVQIGLHALAWQLLLAGLGVHRAPRHVFSLFLGTEAVRMTLPAGPAAGETMQVWLLKSRYAVDLADAVSSVAVKKLLVVATNALYAGLALALLLGSGQKLAIGGLGGRGLYWIIAGSIGALVVAGTTMALLMVSGGVASRIGNALERIPIAALARWAAAKEEDWRRADAVLAGPLARERLRGLLLPGALILGQWFLEAAETWLILFLCGARVGAVPVLTIEVCASLLRSAAFAVPGALGVQDAGYVALLGAFGVPDAPSLGAAFVLLKRGKELLWSAAGYAILGFWGARPRPSGVEP